MSEWRIICGDVENVLREYPATHFDACVCDPPYGLSFMGNRWDYQVPAVALWQQVLRVLKPGAPLLAFGGTRTVHRVTINIEDAGFDIEDQVGWFYGTGKPATKHRLKPAHEPIVLARRPYPGTLAMNLSRWGVGALAIEECRVAVKGSRPKRTAGAGRKSAGVYGDGMKTYFADGETAKGRWPANLILDEEAGAMLDAQAGERKSGISVTRNGGGGKMFEGLSGKPVRGYSDRARPDSGYTDSGGACAKVKGAEGAGNTHPTKKPLALTEYLARLVLPAKPGTILVPFAGSGSEVIGALRAGWPSVLGIEREAQYIEIAEGRLRNAAA